MWLRQQKQHQQRYGIPQNRVPISFVFFIYEQYTGELQQMFGSNISTTQCS